MNKTDLIAAVAAKADFQRRTQTQQFQLYSKQ